VTNILCNERVLEVPGAMISTKTTQSQIVGEVVLLIETGVTAGSPETEKGNAEAGR